MVLDLRSVVLELGSVVLELRYAVLWGSRVMLCDLGITLGGFGIP